MSFNILELINKNDYNLYKTYKEIRLINSNNNDDDLKEFGHFDSTLILYIIIKNNCKSFIYVLHSPFNVNILGQVFQWNNLDLVEYRDKYGLFSILSVLEKDDFENLDTIFKIFLFTDEYNKHLYSLDSDEKLRYLWRMICKYDSHRIAKNIISNYCIIVKDDKDQQATTPTLRTKLNNLSISALEILNFTALNFSVRIFELLFHYFPNLSNSIKPTPIKEIRGIIAASPSSSNCSIKLLRSGFSYQYLTEIHDRQLLNNQILRAITYLRYLSKKSIHIDTEISSNERKMNRECFYKGAVGRYDKQPWSILYQAVGNQFGINLAYETISNLVGGVGCDNQKIQIQFDQLISSQQYVYLVRNKLSSVTALIRNESILFPKLSDNITFSIATLCSEKALKNYMKRYDVDPLFKLSLKDLK